MLKKQGIFRYNMFHVKQMPEIWDLYDKDGNPLNKTIERGQPLAKGEYIIAVDVWKMNDKGQILLTQRHPSKELFPLKWECTCGAKISGEDSLTGALREVKEETGIELDPKDGKKIHRIVRPDSNIIFDIYLFRTNTDIKNTKLQENEVIAIKWVSKDELRELFRKGEMIDPLDYVLKMMDDGIFEAP